MARPNRIRIRDEEVRARIKTNELIDRLQKDAFSEKSLTDGERRSIEILLRKALPDLSHITVAGDKKNPVEVNINLV